MKISFPDRDISKGPLEVLRHLYYYTTQYGLSVRQYTGRDLKYWEKLPDRLECVRGSTRKLDNVIGELKDLAREAPERLRKRRAQIGRMDREEETLLRVKRRLDKASLDVMDLEGILRKIEKVHEAITENIGTERHPGKTSSEDARILADATREFLKLKKGTGDPQRAVKRLKDAVEGLRRQIYECYADIRGKWAEKEVVLNAQLVTVLATLPGELLALLFRRLTSSDVTPRGYRVVDLRIIKESYKGGSFVEPDLLLLGGNRLLMVEMKTRGGAKSSRSYPPGQLLNYIRLVVECGRLEDESLPSRFAHLILAPSTDPKWLEEHDKWIQGPVEKSGGELRIRPEVCLKLGKPFGKEDRRLMLDALRHTPVYYHSWKQLAGAYVWAAREYGDAKNQAHWERIGNELEYLARRAGKYA